MGNDAIPGVVRGNKILLDAPLPALDGRRVRVVVEPVEDDAVELTATDQERLWDEWETSGPKGPIDEDDGWDTP
jgi:hypothetical protein